jgi:hypothetical protein
MTKKVWRKPEVKSIVAGGAEVAKGTSNDGPGNSSVKS